MFEDTPSLHMRRLDRVCHVLFDNLEKYYAIRLALQKQGVFSTSTSENTLAVCFATL
jgi:hypothetical protein